MFKPCYGKFVEKTSYGLLLWLLFAFFAVAAQPQTGANTAQARTLTQIQLDQARADIRRLRLQLAAAHAELAALRIELEDALEKISALTSIEQSIEQKPEGEQSP